MEAILIALAGSVVAPVIKKILGDKLGGVGGELAGRVVDMIAEKAGVPVEQLADAKNLPAAIEAAEPMAVELLAQHVESQRLMNETLQAELDKGGPTWTWAWRPFGMWLFLAIIAHLTFLVPLLNIVLTSPLILVLDVPTIVTLFLTYTGLYMGGHTAKAAVESWRKK